MASIQEVSTLLKKSAGRASGLQLSQEHGNMTWLTSLVAVLVTADPVELPDMRSVPADLVTPAMVREEPAAGRRVRGVLPGRDRKSGV